MQHNAAIRSSDALEASVNRLNPFWIAISCGYMVSWTSIGSLISYFKARQGAAFYVALYCAFYLPGLPVSLLQQRFDEKFDRRLGSAKAFMLRVSFSMAVKICILFIMPFVPFWVPSNSVPYVILCCMSLEGTFSWLCHGTACQLCVSSKLSLHCIQKQRFDSLHPLNMPLCLPVLQQSMFPPSSTAYLTHVR